MSGRDTESCDNTDVSENGNKQDTPASGFKKFLIEVGDAFISEILGNLLFVLPAIVFIFFGWLFIAGGVSILILPLIFVLLIAYRHFVK